MKKLFTFLLALLAGAGTMFAESGSCGKDGDNLTWELDNNGILYITGTGAMADWTYDSPAPWYDKRTSIQSVEIEEGVTSIGNSAFYDCTKITYAIIPNSVTGIGDDAFGGCAFTSVTIPKSVTSIGRLVFTSCNKLTAINVDKDNTKFCSVDGVLFNKDQTKLIQYPGGLQGAYTVPNTVTNIGDDAFNLCSGLTDVTIPSGVTRIGYGAFFSTSLKTVDIPETVTGMGWNAFNGCKYLTAINVSPKNTTFCSVDGVWFYKDLTKVIRYPQAKSGEFILPDNLTTIGQYAFSNCPGLTAISIGSKVTSIGEMAFYGCSGLKSITTHAVQPPVCDDEDCFNGVDKSIPVYVPEGSVETYTKAPVWKDFTNIQSPCVSASGTCGADLTWELTCDGVLTISGTGNMTNWNKTNPWSSHLLKIQSVIIEEGVTSIGNYAFYDCYNLRSISIPNSLKCIWGHAFLNCSALDGVAFGSELEIIASYAFEGCKSLTAITIPKNVTNIGYSAFRGCSGLASIIVESGNMKYKKCEDFNAIINYDNQLVVGCKNTVIPTGYLLSIAWYAFDGCSEMTSIDIPTGITEIQQGAFRDCSSLTAITLPKRITKLSDDIFNGCSSLSSVTLNGEVTQIGAHAFAGCEKLTDFDIPATVTEIGKYAFDGCSSLTAATLPGDLKRLEEGAFLNCSSLAEIVIPNSIYWIDQRTFSGCSAMKTVTIPEGLTSIGYYAFAWCSSLTEVTFPETVTKLGEGAFYDCQKLKRMICYPVEPPTCGKEAFYWVGGDLYVPEESVEIYSNTEPWSGFNISAFPATSGTCGDNITWDLTDGVLTISGTGEMTWKSFFAPWYFYYSSIKSVVIGEGVTNMGYLSAYSGCTNLTSVSLSSTVNSFGQAGFITCTALTSFEVAPANSTFCAIDGVLFTKDQKTISQYPTGRKGDYSIPASVDSIGYVAFGGCAGLTTVTIPATVTKIGHYAFYDCTGLDTIICEATTPPLCWDYCFDGVDNTSVIVLVPKGTVENYQNADGWSDFTHIQVNPIAAHGICGKEGDNLTWILNQEGVLTISGTGEMADNVASWVPFRADIKSIVIGDGATSIGKEAFAECTNLTAITIPESITSISSYVFSGCAKLTEFVIPTAVTEIGNYAFAGCSGLTDITIPRFVTKIGEKAFADCTGLTTITSQAVTPPDCGTDCFQNVNKSIPVNVPEESLEDYKKANEWKDFTKMTGKACVVASGTNGPDKQLTWTLSCGGTLRIEGKGKMSAISEYFYYPWDEYSSEIKSVIVGEGVTLVSGEAFSNLENLESISLPNSLVTIEPGAFHGNDKLTSVLIPKNVLFIYDKAFSYCTSLTTLVFCGLTSIYENAFYFCNALTSITCFSVEPLYCKGLAYGDATYEESAKDLPVYVPAESVSKYKAHSGWKMYKILPLSERPNTRIIDSGTAGAKITWTLDSNGILTIKGSGVMDKWGKPAAAPDGKRHLPAEYSAPWYPYLADIQYIVIESGITTIGDYAFNGCTEVRSITCYAATPPTCGAEAFGGIDHSIPLYVPETSVEAYQDAYQWKEFDVQADERQTPTALITPDTNRDSQASKVIRNDVMYIIRPDGKTYSVIGQRTE